MNSPALIKANIEALLQMALDRSSTGRNALARSVADICLEQNLELSEKEVQLTFDILHQLIHDVEMRVRRDLAQRLAPRRDVPRDLIVTLANDQIDVAYPILVESEVLEDDDLIAITRNQPTTHQIAVTLRKHLSAAVSEALVDTDNLDVIDSLIRNPAAELSEPTMRRLVEMSRDAPPLRRPLLQRPDLRPDLAWQMYSWVGDALKDFVTKNFPAEIDKIDTEIDDAVRDAMRVADAAPPRDLWELVLEVEQTSGISAAAMIEILRDQDVELFEAMFARLANLDMLAMPVIVYDPGGESFAIACKACNFSQSDFEQLYLLLMATLIGGQDEETRDFQAVQSFYKRLDGGAARAVLTEWRRTPATAWKT